MVNKPQLDGDYWTFRHDDPPHTGGEALSARRKPNQSFLACLDDWHGIYDKLARLEQRLRVLCKDAPEDEKKVIWEAADIIHKVWENKE